MNPLTLEWIEKAEKDYGTASREFRVKISANYDGVCFHCQQCAEKYVKGFLQEQVISFGKTHNLVHLLDLVVPSKPAWEIHRQELHVLSGFAVQLRYPGDSADKSMAKESLRFCRIFRKFVRGELGLLRRKK
ncbi:MAG: HEPN domain-containing protein [Candidatus Ozemobacteraceae bacterium]